MDNNVTRDYVGYSRKIRGYTVYEHAWAIYSLGKFDFDDESNGQNTQRDIPIDMKFHRYTNGFLISMQAQTNLQYKMK